MLSTHIIVPVCGRMISRKVPDQFVCWSFPRFSLVVLKIFEIYQKIAVHTKGLAFFFCIQEKYLGFWAHSIKTSAFYEAGQISI